MCNPIVCFLAFLIHDVSWTKIFEDVFSGLVLIWVGFWAFKKQMAFKASSEVVREKCAELEKVVTGLLNFNKKFRQIEMEITVLLVIDEVLGTFDSQSVPGYIAVVKAWVEPVMSLEVPDTEAKTAILQPCISMLEAKALGVQSSLEDFWIKLNGFGEKIISQEEVMSSWQQYRANCESFSNRLEKYQSLTFRVVSGAYDWAEFEKEVKKLYREKK